MNLHDIKLQLNIRTAYEETYNGGQSMATRIIKHLMEDVKPADITPVHVEVGRLIRHYNFYSDKAGGVATIQALGIILDILHPNDDAVQRKIATKKFSVCAIEDYYLVADRVKDMTEVECLYFACGKDVVEKEYGWLGKLDTRYVSTRGHRVEDTVMSNGSHD